MRNPGDFVLGMLAGAGMMYLLDPDRGTRRRALVRDQLVHAGHEAGDLGEAAASRGRDIRNRARGAVAETRNRLSKEDVEDSVLEARVRSQLGHHTTEADDILVDVANGMVTLSGAVRVTDVDGLIAGIGKVRGVRNVESALSVSDGAEQPANPDS
jgi:osmotically-inducible protein OsmY